MFLAGTRVSSQKKGLISGKPVVDVVIRPFCKKGSRYCNRVGPAVLPLLAEECLERWLRGLMARQGGRWMAMEGPMHSLQPNLQLPLGGFIPGGFIS